MSHRLVVLAHYFRIYRESCLKYDLIAAMVVFFVAIPLCLGIALASGAPFFAGILSGIIGGIVVGGLSASAVSVSGPAAGLAAIVLTAITQLGSFETFLLALFFAGILQILMGTLSAGILADYVPPHVIHGLLGGVGVLLIFNQLPYIVINHGALFISFISLLSLIVLETSKHHRLKRLPASILVVLIGTVINEMLLSINSNFAQQGEQLVYIPHLTTLKDWLKQLHFPNWSAWSHLNVYNYGLILAIVASLESLLNIKASENIDPKKRRISKNRELVAQGLGNLIAGLIGGVPVTSVIVRTSVNIQAGSKTKFSAIFHGCYIFLAILFIPALLNHVPLCSLAAILVFTGYKLASPKLFKIIYQQGPQHFIPFIATLLGVATFNVLAGIMFGMLLSLVMTQKSTSMIR